MIKFLDNMGLLVPILTAILTVVVIPLIHQATKNVKNIRIKHALDLVDSLAENAVAQMATHYTMPSEQKKAYATKLVMDSLAKHNIKLNQTTIASAVELAYQQIFKNDIPAKNKQNEIIKANEQAIKENKKETANIDLSSTKDIDAELKSLAKGSDANA